MESLTVQKADSSSSEANKKTRDINQSGTPGPVLTDPRTVFLRVLLLWSVGIKQIWAGL